MAISMIAKRQTCYKPLLFVNTEQAVKNVANRVASRPTVAPGTRTEFATAQIFEIMPISGDQLSDSPTPQAACWGGDIERQSNARRHILVRSAREIFCDGIHFRQAVRTNANQPSTAISVASRRHPSATS